MNFTRRNLQTYDLIDAVRLLSGSNQTKAQVQAVYARQSQGEWQYAIGRCALADESKGESVEIYRDYAFVSKPFPEFSVERFLAEGLVLSKDFPPVRITTTNPAWNEEIVPSHISGSGCPVRKFATQIVQNATFPDAQLLAYGMPFHRSAARYVRDFLGLRDFHGSNDGRRGEFSIEINDKRGNIQLEQNRLSISKRTEDLCLVGQINEGPPISLMNDESTSVDCQGITNIELWLLTKGSEVIDYRSSTEWPYRYETGTGQIQHEEELKSLIRRGESELCEFKAYIDLTDQNKSLEIDKTVCAFSNQHGGTLFLGVNNEGDVVGLAKHLAKLDGANIDEAGARYASAIHTRLRESLKNNQCFSIEIIKLYSNTLIVVAVGKSPEINFLLNFNQAYIRQGGTNEKISPQEISSRGQGRTDLFSRGISS